MRRFLLFALAATLFAACSKDAINEPTGIILDDNRTLTVSFEGDAEDTRIQLNEEKKSVWTEGDLVSVFYRSDANQKWQYTGKTGARVGELTRVDAGTATTKTTRVVVVYPYNEDYYLNTEFYEIQAFMPATQTYLKDSYGLDGNIMISQSTYNQIALKNVCGWLKLQLTGNGEQIKYITVRGNNGEQVAGELYIDSADATATLASDMGDVTEDEGENVAGGAGGNLVFEDTVLKEVTLTCVDGVTLGAEATAFYIALPPQTFTKGITVEITDTNGLVMTKSTDNEVVIERNHIQPMTTFDYNGILKPANNEIYYTNGSTTAPTPPNNKTAFGSATIQSNTYDAEKECWVITFDKDITEIGYYAFNGRSSLTSVTIPDSVTTIGDYAFWSCYSLTSVNIPNSVTTIGGSAFSYCSSLTSVTIGDSVTTIGAGAFSCCDSLTSVTLPDSVTTIGFQAFSYCHSLTNMTIPDSVTTIGEGAFSGCKSLKEFKGKFAADNGRCLIKDNTIISYAEASGTTYTIPDSITKIGDEAFYNCISLTSVTIPDSVTTIGFQAFCYCWSLTSVTIPDSVTTIGVQAFFYCINLTSVTIGDSVTTIGAGAFCGCDGLKEFKGKFAADGGRCLIVDGVLNAFALGCGVTQYTIPDSVTTIGFQAFSPCNSLTSVTIGDSVTKIGEEAFYECDSLTSVTIGDSVTAIGSDAFYECRRLKYVYCKPTTPPAGGGGMFDDNAAGRRIFVPASDDDSIINAYKKASGWSSYASNIFEEE